MQIDIEKELKTHGIKAETVAFMGPRPAKLGGYDVNNYAKLNETVTNIVESLISYGTTSFVTNGAQGFNQMVFWTIDSARKCYSDIQNKLCLPFDGQEKKWTEDGIFGQRIFRQLKINATNKRFIGDLNGSDDYKVVAEALRKCDETIVDETDLLIALYPSYTWMKDSDDETSSCMRYAAKANKPILQLLYTVENNVPCITEYAIIK